MAESFNPLNKLNLAKSIQEQLLAQSSYALAHLPRTEGAGVYALYYLGPFKPYEPIAKKNLGGQLTQPIYVGKAIPKGGRRGGLKDDASATGPALFDRLRKHASSIKAAENLNVADFSVRCLTVDDIWIPLGENMLIESFKPLWNFAVDGFGNNPPGKGRDKQFKSPWDVLHPGRKSARKLPDGGLTQELVVRRVEDFFENRELTKLPRNIEEEQIEVREEAEEAGDEI